MYTNGIITLEQLYQITNFFTEQDINTSNMTILIEVADQKTLNRINADIYYRNQENVDEDVVFEDVNEININIGNLKFKYVIKDANAEG